MPSATPKDEINSDLTETRRSITDYDVLDSWDFSDNDVPDDDDDDKTNDDSWTDFDIITGATNQQKLSENDSNPRKKANRNSSLDLSGSSEDEFFDAVEKVDEEIEIDSDLFGFEVLETFQCWNCEDGQLTTASARGVKEISKDLFMLSHPNRAVNIPFSQVCTVVMSLKLTKYVSTVGVVPRLK